VHDDLIAQARRLARLDPKKPKQVNLRRAVSSTYYALFHFLVDASCRSVMGTTSAQRPYRHVLGRAFVHTTMASACKSFSGGTLPQHVTSALPAFVVPPAMQRISQVFRELQGRRHVADYDLAATFTRHDVLSSVRIADEAMRDFRALPMSDERTFFLACLWAWGVLGNR
jgi:hypothetical protein